MNKKLENLFDRKYNNQKNHLCVPGIKEWLDDILVLLFPMMGQKYFKDATALKNAFLNNQLQFNKILKCQTTDQNLDLNEISSNIFLELFIVEEELNKDAEFFLDSDPACLSIEEVISSYPGFYAIACYRIANMIASYDYPLIARMITQAAHQKSGVDIHPKAKIGCPFFIDHGTGIVIGETTIIGNNVSLYQGVTLGALKVNKQMNGVKRHPTVGDNCIIYANATILGGETTIGENSVIGGNVWLAKSVEANSKIYN